jgi:hypothetical protein
VITALPNCLPKTLALFILSCVKPSDCMMVFSFPLSLSLIIVSRHEWLCSNDHSHFFGFFFFALLVSSFLLAFSFSHSLFPIIIIIKLVRTTAENNNHPFNTIIRTRSMRIHPRLFSLSGYSQRRMPQTTKKREKKEQRK